MIFKNQHSLDCITYKQENIPKHFFFKRLLIWFCWNLFIKRFDNVFSIFENRFGGIWFYTQMQISLLRLTHFWQTQLVMPFLFCLSGISVLWLTNPNLTYVWNKIIGSFIYFNLVCANSVFTYFSYCWPILFFIWQISITQAVILK